MAGAIPRKFQLGLIAPVAMDGNKRRIIAPCTNVVKAFPEDTISIFPDVSTPSAFMDPDGAAFICDFTIKNNRYDVDYVNWSIGGVVHAMIRDLEWKNGGNDLETMKDYNRIADTHFGMLGILDEETYYYMSQKLKVGGAEEYHRNLIKPPMCDSSGNIMHGPNPMGLGFDTECNLLDQTGNSSATTTAAAIDKRTDIVATQQTFNNGNTRLQVVAGATNADLNTTTTPLFIGAMPYCNTALKNTKMPWTTNVSALSIIGSDAKCDRFTPYDWPDSFVPGEMSEIAFDYTKKFGTVCRPQVMANLVNVKCFPVGVVPPCDNYNSGGAYASHNIFKSTTAYTTTYAPSAGDIAKGKQSPLQPAEYSITYRVMAPLLSCIGGLLANKVTFTSIMSPTSFFLQLKLAPVHHVFQVGFDPCRRIAGTIRDCVRNTGIRNGQLWGDITYTGGQADSTGAVLALPTTGGDYPTRHPLQFATTAFGVGYSPGYSIPTVPTNNRIGSFFNSIFSLEAASGKFAIGSSLVNSSGTITGFGAVTATAKITHPFLFPERCPAAPQYILSTNPWIYKCLSPAGNALANGFYDYQAAAAGVTGAPLVMANDNQVLYGTCLNASVQQCARIMTLSYTGSPSTDTSGLTYEITNIGLMYDQIVLPREVFKDIAAQADSGGFSYTCVAYRSYPIQVANSQTQNIILAAKVLRAKQLIFKFQDNRQLDPNTAWFHDSFCGLNPFALVEAGGNNTLASIAGYRADTSNAINLTGVGWKEPLNYIASPLHNRAAIAVSANTVSAKTPQNMSAQFSIGAALFPNNPYTTMQEMMVEYVKMQEQWHNFKSQLAVDVKINTAVVGGTAIKYFDCLQPNKFTTAFVPVNCLDDQTICCNPDMAPLYPAFPKTLTAAATVASDATATETSPYNGLRFLCPRGFRIKNMFMPPSSRFHLIIDLKTFDASDGVESGEPIGNQNMVLAMTGTCGLNADNARYVGTCIISHEAVMRYTSGGGAIWLY